MVTQSEAVARGFAGFNECDTVCIDVPDGQTTYTFRTSDGKRLTACFLPSRMGEPPSFVDVAYHGKVGETVNIDGRKHQAFEAITFGLRDSGSAGIQFDSREHKSPTNIVCVLMEPVKAR